ncbi:hypothetical protein Egran_04493 [Elaphomyces granulatus]|uniref:MHD domain-containing protein n=1 Tax=Elaphomyces granulatus TaxID=519963 RepID=A0A232LUH9_9EURO|nr:hypothetical protein Egran_04493 [Elaphomyces granulatus]
MMSSAIEALYIYDERNIPILEQVYRSRPPSATSIIPLYLAYRAPRPSLIYLPNASPPVTVFSIVHSNLLFLSPSSVESESLLVLEFLHRVIDVLEVFLGAPLLTSKLQASYDVVAQLLNEMCDAGLVCNTESNALQENVEIPGWMEKFLGGVGLPGRQFLSSSSPALAPPSNQLKQPLSVTAQVSGPAIPWRRQGVRHTSNELYVDIVESLSVVMAPSGRLISALVSGTIAFTAKISGVPDLLLTLSALGGQHTIARKLELPVFHPCVRLARWRERPGELSFVPPDGRFILAGYEVNLLPVDASLDKSPTLMEKLFLPAIVDIRKSLGSNGTEFEVRLTLNMNFPGAPATRIAPGGRSGSGTSTPSFLGGPSSGSSSSPTLDEVVITVPISKYVRNIIDMHPSRGDATYSPGSEFLEWRVPTRDGGSISGTATLRCTVVGHHSAEDEPDETEAEASQTADLLQGYYVPDSYQQPGPSTYSSSQAVSKKGKSKSSKSKSKSKKPRSSPLTTEEPSPSLTPPPSNSRTSRKALLNAAMMPTSASVSFSVRGWLPSGLRVDSLVIDPRRSRGLGENVRPYKGVKYLCVSRRGVERRC